MMRPDRRDSGFTLVELVVYMAVASVVTMAAITVLLLGLRINKQSTDTVKNQNTTRILLSALEDIATEGEIKQVVVGYDSWTIKGEGPSTDDSDDIVLFQYRDHTISTGDTALLTEVLSSYVEWNDNLLTFSVETEGGIYTSSAYCRTAAQATGSTGSILADDKVENVLDSFFEADGTIIQNNATSNDSSDARLAFLTKLAAQYGSKGEIKGATASPKYFSEWYIGDYAKNPGWNSQTPWCACFVSWGLDQVGDKIIGTVPKHANVDYFKEDFVSRSKWKDSAKYGGDYNPVSGDIIFFDWIINSEANPQHVGVVLTVLDEYVYTIEGNSDNQVAVRKYKLDDPRVIGYGVIDWENG